MLIEVGTIVLRRDGLVHPVTGVTDYGWLELGDTDEVALPEEVIVLNPEASDSELCSLARDFGIDATPANRVPRLVRELVAQSNSSVTFGVGDIVEFAGKTLTIKDRTDDGFIVKVKPVDGRAFTSKETYTAKQIKHWQQTGAFEDMPPTIINMSEKDRDALVQGRQDAIARAETAEEQLAALREQIEKLQTTIDEQQAELDTHRRQKREDSSKTLYVRPMTHVTADELQAWERAGWETECQFQPGGTLHVICRGRFAAEPAPLRDTPEKKILSVHYIDSRMYGGADDERTVADMFSDSPFAALLAQNGDTEALKRALDESVIETATNTAKAVLNGS